MFCSEAGKRKEVDIRQGAPWSRVINEPRSRKRTAAALSCQLTITTLPPPSYPHHQLSDAKLARLPFPTPHGRTVPAVVRTEQSPTTVGRNPPQRDQRWERLTSRSVVVPVSFPLFFFDSCATTLNPERTFIFILSSCLLRIVDSATSLQAPGPTAPVNQYLNVEPNHYGNPSGSSRSSRLADDQPQLTSASTAPRPPPSKPIEYQWSDDLIEALLALPPRSGYIGKFSIVADPTVNNHTRARLFTRQLRDRAVHISCVVVPSPASTFPQDHVALTFLFFLSVLTQGPITADFPGHGQQQFFLAPVILHLSGRVSGSVRHLC